MDNEGDRVTGGYTFEVPGCPVPKQRARRGRHGRWYTPQATRSYEAKVGWAAKAAGLHAPHNGLVGLKVRLWFPDRRRRDVDNVVKAIMDALNGLAYSDDSQVIELFVSRQVDRQRPRAEVTVERISEYTNGDDEMESCREQTGIGGDCRQRIS